MNTDIFVVIEHIRGQVADITNLTLAAGHKLTQANGGEVVAVLLAHKGQELASDIAADRVIYMDHPFLADFTSDSYQCALKYLIQIYQPRLVLLGETTIGSDIAGSLSAQLNLPLVSYCLKLSAIENTIRFSSQICGGKIIAEGELTEPTALVTMIPGGYKLDIVQSMHRPGLEIVEPPIFEQNRVTLNQYIESEITDIDITKEAILVAVGRGIQSEENLVLVEELVDALGGAICASRPVVDQGWLPTNRLVGKSGKRVSPKLYLALGISGAPEHVEAISNSETIIAINTDPTAPIFNVAQYGAVIDLFDLLPVLVEKARATRMILAC